MALLHEQRPKLGLPSLRRALTKVHLDLFTIDSKVDAWLAHYPSELTDLEKLILVLEDRRFGAHHGFDWKALVRETTRAITFRRHGGASTIDMQFVRTCTGYRQRTMGRKLYEILLAFFIQFRYSKIVILRSYLQCAFFGSRLHGTEAAAGAVFQKRPDNLSLDEAAFVPQCSYIPSH